MSDNKFSKIRDRLIGMRTIPTVGVFVDVDGVYDELEGPEDHNGYLAEAAQAFAQSVGRITHACMYYENGNIDDPPVDPDDWYCHDFTVVPTQEDESANDINLSLLFDAHALGQQGAFQVCVLVVGTTNYQELARRLISNGITVVLVANYERALRYLPKDSCVYVPIKSVVQEEAVSKGVRRTLGVDPETFDFKTLIELLADSESLMPFVGAKYFVNRVMWRLKKLRTHEDKQGIFQEAAQRGIIEIYETGNVEGQEHAVSACRLRRDHPLVAECLDAPTVVNANSDQHITITIEGQSETATIAVPSDHIPTL